MPKVGLRNQRVNKSAEVIKEISSKELIMNEIKYIIEIASSDFLTTKSAVEGGADRIELCANLAEGGTTPSYGTYQTMQGSFYYFDLSYYSSERW